MYAKIARPFVFLFVLIALVSLACGIDFGTDTPTAAPPPTSIPTQEPAGPVATEVTAQQSEESAYLTIEFDEDPADWSYFTSKNKSSADDSNVAPYTENGFFIFDIDEWLNVYATYDPWTYSDVSIDVGVDNRGHNDNNINIVCRYSDAGWYEVSIANSGLYWIYAVDTAYHSMANGGSNDIRQGKDFNEYTVACKGNTISLSINGTKVKSYTDNQYGFSDGQIGLGLSSFGHSPVKVAFDWVTISEP